MKSFEVFYSFLGLTPPGGGEGGNGYTRLRIEGERAVCLMEHSFLLSKYTFKKMGGDEGG